MRGLSLTNPWPHAILHLGKRVENRSWPTCHYRGPIALHASKTRRVGYGLETIAGWVAAGVMDREELGGDLRGFFDRLPFGAIVGTAQVVGWISPGGPDVMERLGLAQARWYWGAGALVLDDVVALAEPVPCKGALGLWMVDDGLRGQIEKAAAA